MRRGKFRQPTAFGSIPMSAMWFVPLPPLVPVFWKPQPATPGNKEVEGIRNVPSAVTPSSLAATALGPTEMTSKKGNDWSILRTSRMRDERATIQEAAPTLATQKEE